MRAIAILALLLLAAGLAPANGVVLWGEARLAARQLVLARDLAGRGKGAEAAALLLTLSDSGADGLVSVAGGRFLRTRDAAQAEVARLGADVLAEYRRLRTASARK